MAIGARPVAVILGAQGTLGAALTAGLPGAGWEVALAATRADCDITRRRGGARACCARVRPTVVFNAAAYTDVDRAESEPDRAHAVNAAAPGGDRGGRRRGRRGRHPLFDGLRLRRQPGASLRRARSAVAAGALRAVEGGGRPARRRGESRGTSSCASAACTDTGGRNFPSTIVRRLRAGETIRADRDRVGSPTWVREVAAVSAALARTEHYGLYHCTAQGETTWADFARLAATLIGAPAERVQACRLRRPEAQGAAPAPRGARQPALREIGLDTMSSWQDSLRAFVAAETG